MTVRRCLIHIGLAKTGTTAIQTMLERNVERLARHGWVYPRAGCKMPITPHHDLVADLAAHRSDIGRMNNLAVTFHMRIIRPVVGMLLVLIAN